MTIRFERNSGGIEEYDCETYDFAAGGLILYRHTKGKHNAGIPLYYIYIAVPAIDIRYFEEVIPEDDRG